MNKLITASLMAKNLGRLVSFPKELIDTHELEVISWIADYNTKYGETPTLERLEEEFEDFIHIELGEFNLDDIADQTIENKRLSFFVSKMTDVIDKTRLEGQINEHDVYSIMRTVSSANETDMAYTTFDRSKYKSRSSSRSISFFSGILNRAMGNLHDGDYCLVVARLGTGKSLITQWQAKQWLLEGRRVLFVSQEMLAAEVFARIDGMVASFNPLELRKTDGMDLTARLQVAQMTAKGSGGEIYAPKGLKTPEQIAMAARFFSVDAVVVDGVYQLAPDLAHMPAARWERITEVSGQLKQMAQSIKRPLLATTQIKRTEKKSDALTPEDIAFADALGQDADQVIAMHKDVVRADQLEAMLIKNRYGPEVTALLKLNFDSMKIEEVR